MLRLAEVLAPKLNVIRFNFPYRDQGSKRPDAMPVLKQTVVKVAEAHRRSGGLLIGGRSMGGRAASMLAADGFACDGLLLFAYPLHPAGQPEKLRDAHLAKVRVPVLCFNGTKDALCTRQLMDRAVGALPNWQMHWLEGAGHSFRVADYAEIGNASARWLAEIGL